MHDLGIANTRNTDEFDQMNRMFAELYPDVPVPKSVWRWIDAAQHRLAGAGAAMVDPAELSVNIDSLGSGLGPLPVTWGRNNQG
jgi:hypothetical protein